MCEKEREIGRERVEESEREWKRVRERKKEIYGVSSLVEEKCGPPRFLPRHKNQLETKKM